MSKVMRPNWLRNTALTTAGALVIGGPVVYQAAAANPVGQELTQLGAEPKYFELKRDDAAMHRAALKARRTVGTFIAALQHPAPGQQDFAVKKAFMQGNAVEHLWLSDVRFIGNRFQGFFA